MASVKIRLNKNRLLRDGTYPLVMQVICNRRKKQIATDYHLRAMEFETKKEEMIYVSGINTRSTVKEVNKKLQKTKMGIIQLLNKLKMYNSNYTIEDFIAVYKKSAMKDDFSSYMQEQVEIKKSMKKDGTARAYQSTLNSLERFFAGKSFKIAEINSLLVGKYECYLITNGITPNSISFYMRNFRAVYNRMKRERGESIAENPFEDIHTSIAKTNKRALKKEDIIKISNLDLHLNPSRQRAADIFMFSFHTMGMAFIDVMRLKKENLSKDSEILTYYRTKTNQLIKVPLNDYARNILARYGKDDSDYLFPFVDPIYNEGKTFYKNYRSELGKTNYYLKLLGEELELSAPLTSYVARHSWASVANSTGASVSVISTGLGHTSIKTTEIYLKEIDLSQIKTLNECVTRM